MEKAWVVAVNMGYGHQRAAYPLKSLAYKGKIICANDYEGIPIAIGLSGKRVNCFMKQFPVLSECRFLVNRYFQ